VELGYHRLADPLAGFHRAQPTTSSRLEVKVPSELLTIGEAAPPGRPLATSALTNYDEVFACPMFWKATQGFLAGQALPEPHRQ
jgi:hypothetical protein